MRKSEGGRQEECSTRVTPPWAQQHTSAIMNPEPLPSTLALAPEP